MIINSPRWLCLFFIIASTWACDESDESNTILSDDMGRSVDACYPMDDVNPGGEDVSVMDMMVEEDAALPLPMDMGLIPVELPALDSFRTLDLTLSEPLAIQPSLAWGADGALGMAWCGMTEDNLGVWFGLWDGQGSEITDPFILATATQGLQNEPAACALAGGGYAVAWSVDSQEAPTNLQVRFRVVNGAGEPVNAEDIRIGSDELGNHWLADVACAPAGGFTVVGTASEPNGTFGIFAQHFDAMGVPTSEKEIVNTVADGNQVYPAAATDGAGNTLVVWEDRAPDAETIRLLGRWIDGDAQPLGDVFTLSEPGVAVATPAISMNPATGVATVLGVQDQRRIMVYEVSSGAESATALYSPDGGLTYNGQLEDLGEHGRALMHLSGSGQSVDVRLTVLGTDNTVSSEVSLDIGPLPPYAPSVAFAPGKLAAAWTRRGEGNATFLRLALFGADASTEGGE